MSEAAGQRRARLESAALMAGTALLLWLCWIMLRPFVQVMVWAAVMAILFFPAYQVLHRRLRRPALSAAASIVLVLLTVVGPLMFVTAAVVRELAGLAGQLQDAAARLQADPAAAEAIARLRGAAQEFVDVDKLLSQENLRALAGNASEFLVTRSAGLLGNLLNAVVSATLTIFTLYYLFRDGESIARVLPDLLPLERDEAVRIINRARDMIRASVYGVVVIAVIQGTLGGAMFAVLGLPSPFVWGVVMTVLSTIPMAGSAIVWAPAAAYLFVTGQYGRGALLVAWGVLVIGTVDNLLRPRLVGRRTQMNELFIFFSVLGGLSAFGMVGLLLGPVVVAIALALIQVLFGVPVDPAPARPES